jgi:hypothetical protein
MTTPTGQIAASDVNVELGRAWNSFWHMNDSAVRALSGQTSGYVDMWTLRGKSSYTPLSASSNGVHYHNSSPNTSSIQSYPQTCYLSYSGGSGTITFQWAWQNGNSGGISLTNDKSQNCTVSVSTRFGTNNSGTLQCTITDGTGATYTVYNIPVEFAIGTAV